MNISLVDLQSEYQHLKSEIDRAVESVLASGHFIGGGMVKEFQGELGGYLNVDHVIPCGNGTDALQLALMALGIKNGDEVIVPAFTFVSPAECALLLGATPVFADIHPDSYNIEPKAIEQAVTEKTKAIIVVHLFGQTANMPEIMEVAQKYDIPVIEDVAQALGAQLNNSFAGTIGDIGTTSFFPSKNLGAYGDGGAVFTNNVQHAEACRGFANHGMTTEKFYHHSVGINSRLDALQAAILKVKLQYFNQSLQNRKAHGRFYNEQLAQIEEIKLPEPLSGMDHTYHQYVIRIDEKVRSKFQQYLKDNGIATGIYYPYALPDLPAYESEKLFPIASQASKQTLALPVHPYLSKEQLSYIVEKIKEYFSG